jgi:hypothetical protein
MEGLNVPRVAHRFVAVDGVRVFYRDAGPPDAPTMLLLHGFPSASHQFRRLIDALGSRYRLIAPLGTISIEEISMQHSESTAEHRAHMPEGTQRILNTRSLQTAHRRLVALLRPGLTVLEMGCGTGAMTRDIAAAVAPHGQVVGVDINAALIEEARRVHGAVPGLAFEVCDIYTLPDGRAVIGCHRFKARAAAPDDQAQTAIRQS